MLLALVGIACNGNGPGPNSPLPGRAVSTVEMGPADAVAAADMNGDGVDEIVRIHAGEVTWPGGSAQVDCAIQVVARGTLAEGGGEQAFLGCGMDRKHLDAPAQIWSVGSGGAKLLFSRPGERAQVSDLRVVEGRLWAAIFSTGFDVEGGWVENGGFTPVTTGRLATKQMPLSEGGVLMGRVYGAAPRSDGDLRLVRGEDQRKLPTWRGVRSLAAWDPDHDGDLDLLVGDGWHFAYAQQARARVWMLEGPDWDRGRTLGFFPSDYTVRALYPVGEGVVAVGTRTVQWLSRDALGWSAMELGAIDETHNAVPVHTKDGPGVLIAGATTLWVPLPTQ
jgi:hypothetical protein